MKAINMVIFRMVLIISITISLYSFANAAAYNVIDLGTLGWPNSQAFDINNHGDVVGYSNVPDGYSHAFLWTYENGMIDLGTIGDDMESGAYAVNKKGVVVGTSRNPWRAFTWKEQSGMTELINLGGLYSWASDINKRGVVAGWSTTTTGESHACIWHPSGKIWDLGTLGGSTSKAEAINDKNQVIGWSENYAGWIHGFLWSKKRGMIDLGRISQINGINNREQVVGRAYGSGEAFIWTEETGVRLLGTINPRLGSTAFDINNQGDVVGDLYGGVGPEHAFLWTEEDGLVDLNDLISPDSGWILEVAMGINDYMEIVGWGQIDLDGDDIYDETRAFLLEPIVE